MLLISGAPRGRTAPLPRILQRCCNPWSRDHKHTHARGSALSTTVWDTREQCALRLESFQHHCVFVLMIIAEWSPLGVIGIAVCVCVVVSSWSLRGRRKMCSLLTTVCEEEIWRILTLCFSVCVCVSECKCKCVCECVIKVKAACDHARVCEIWLILYFTVNRMIRNFTSVCIWSRCGLYDFWMLYLSWIKNTWFCRTD